MSKQVLKQHYQHADKVMLFISYGLTLYALGLASWYGTWLEAIIIGVGSAAALTAIYYLSPGTVLSRCAMGAGFMVFTALHIHQAHGMIEMHFGVFALLAMLLYYRDWLPIVTAAALIAVHHLLFFYLQSQGSNIWVLRSLDMGIWVILLHAAYVVVESSLLVIFANSLKKDAIQSLEIMSVTDKILQDEHIDLTQRTSAVTPLLQRFDSYTGDVEQLATRVRSTAFKLSSEGGDLANITSELKQASQVQQREIDMISSAVEEMTVAIKDVFNNAEQAANSSNQVDTIAREATSVSQTTQSAVQDLAERVAEAARTIDALNEQANSIGSVLGVIRGVAEQTNLLALNAAIEAARAGEQGRGFAVVADEVRTLAQRTQQSTEEIDQMIEQLQAGSHSAVQVINHSRSQAEICVENTGNSLSLMEQVGEAIQEVNKMNAMIAQVSGEQGNVMVDISRNLANILDASNSSAQDSVRASESADQLQRVANDLNELSEGFKVSEM